MNDKTKNFIDNRWKIIKKNKANRSITRLAKESIMQFPMVFSDSLPIDKSQHIVKGIESMLATQMASYLSLHNDINLSENDGIGGYLQTFTNNKAIPDVLQFSQNIASTLKNIPGTSVIGTESIKITPYPQVGVFEPSAVMECLLDAEDVVNAKSLNDLYQPYKDTTKAIENAIVNLHNYNEKVAMEKSSTQIPDKVKTNWESQRDKHEQYKADLRDGVGSELAKARYETPKVPEAATKVSIPKSAFLEPTMIECEFILHGGGEGRILQKVAFGVKVIPRVIPTGAMVSNIGSTLTSSNPVFQFIKWKTGEAKLAKDLVFGVGQAKVDAKAKNVADKLFASLRSLKRKATIGNFTGKNIPVTTTFIITSLEAEIIKQQTGYDLYDEANAAIIMNKLHCMGFGIYNVDTERLDILFDGYSDYISVTLSALTKAANDPTTDILKEFSKILSLYSRR